MYDLIQLLNYFTLANRLTIRSLLSYTTFDYIKKYIATVVTVCLLVTLIPIDAAAANEYEEQKNKKDLQQAVYVPNTGVITPAQIQRAPQLNEATGVISQGEKTVGFWDAKEQKAFAVQQNGEVKFSEGLTKFIKKSQEENQNKQGEAKSSDQAKQSPSKIAEERIPEASQGDVKTQQNQFQKALQQVVTFVTNLIAKKENLPTANNQKSNKIADKQAVHELNKNEKTESQMISGKKRDESAEVSVVNMAKLQEMAAKAGVRLTAKFIKEHDLKVTAGKGGIIAHYKSNDKGAPDLFVAISKNGTVTYSKPDGSITVTTLDKFRSGPECKAYRMTGKVLQAAAGGDQDAIDQSTKENTRGVCAPEMIGCVNEITSPAVQTTVEPQVESLTSAPESKASSESQQTLSTVTGWLSDYAKADETKQAIMAADMAKNLGLSTDQIAKLSSEKALQIIDYLKAQGDKIINCAVQAVANLFTLGVFNKSDVAADMVLTEILSGNLDISNKDEQIELSFFSMEKTAAKHGVNLTGYATDLAGLQQAVADGKGAVAHIKLPDGKDHFVVVNKVENGQVTYTDADGTSKTVSQSDFLSQWSGKILSQNNITAGETAKLTTEEKQKIKGSYYVTTTQTVRQAYVETVKKAVTKYVSVATTAYRAVKELRTRIVNKVITVAQKILSALGLGWITNYVKKVVKEVQKYYVTVQKAYTKYIKKAVTSYITQKITKYKNVIKTIKKWVADPVKTVSNAVNKVKNTVAEINKKGLTNYIAEKASSAINSVAKAVDTALKPLTNAIKSGITKLSNAASNIQTQVQNSLNNIKQKSKDAFDYVVSGNLGKDLLKKAGDIGKAIGGGIDWAANQINTYIVKPIEQKGKELSNWINTNLTVKAEKWQTDPDNTPQTKTGGGDKQQLGTYQGSDGTKFAKFGNSDTKYIFSAKDSSFIKGFSVYINPNDPNDKLYVKSSGGRITEYQQRQGKNSELVTYYNYRDTYSTVPERAPASAIPDRKSPTGLIPNSNPRGFSPSLRFLSWK